MLKFWEDSGNTTLYHNWWGTQIEGVLFKGGLYNDAALLEFLQTELTDIGSMQRYIDVGITDLLKGTYKDEHEEVMNAALVDVLYASFSWAGIFEPAPVLNSKYFDGSVVG